MLADILGVESNGIVGCHPDIFPKELTPEDLRNWVSLRPF